MVFTLKKIGGRGKQKCETFQKNNDVFLIYINSTKVGGNKRSTRTVDQRDGREAKGSG